jgi:hypothetical protein
VPSIAHDVREYIANGASDDAVLRMLRDRHPTCADPRHTLSYYRSEAARGPRQRGSRQLPASPLTLPDAVPDPIGWSGDPDGPGELFDPAMLDQRRRFGLEFEFVNPSGPGARYRSGSEWADVVREALAPWPEQQVSDDHEYRHSTGRTWDVKADGSCEWEMVTPAITAASWPMVVAVLNALVAAGARVDRRCGFHVHHEARVARTTGFVQRLIRLWGALDTPLHEALPTDRRRNTFAERWGREFAEDSAALTDLPAHVRRLGRYQALNLTNWWRHGRVEMRAHQGTLDANKAGWWLLATQRVVDFAQRCTDDQLDRALELHVQRTRTWDGTERQAARRVLPPWTEARRWSLARIVMGDAVQRTLARWTFDRNPDYYRTAFRRAA